MAMTTTMMVVVILEVIVITIASELLYQSDTLMNPVYVQLVQIWKFLDSFLETKVKLIFEFEMMRWFSDRYSGF